MQLKIVGVKLVPTTSTLSIVATSKTLQQRAVQEILQTEKKREHCGRKILVKEDQGLEDLGEGAEPQSHNEDLQ